MKRRNLLTGLLAGSAFTASGAYLWQQAKEKAPVGYGDNVLSLVPEEPAFIPHEPISDSEAPRVQPNKSGLAKKGAGSDKLLDKVRFFEREFQDDIYLSAEERPLFHSVLLRLKRVQRLVGHGNFNILGFDDALKFARNYSSVGEFTPKELGFIEKVFFTNAADYGFLGEKVTTDLTANFPKSNVHKVPYTGHYLLKGDSLSYYEKLKGDVGSNIVLTSGIRSNVKQLHLFLSKAESSSYNLSKASRSLAPPGHSFHAIGDFDVGRLGFGADNFTDKFANTDEFKRMQDLGYVQIRYTEDNRLGVRFEPWHIKVV